MRQGCWTHVLEVISVFSPLHFLFKSQVAIARYSGWQIAYILWGKCYHVTHSLDTCGVLAVRERREVRQKGVGVGEGRIPHSQSCPYYLPKAHEAEMLNVVVT